MYDSDNRVCMPPASKEKKSGPPLSELSQVQWALLECDLNKYPTIQTTMAIVDGKGNGNEYPDTFGLSLCCEGKDNCVDLYVFHGKKNGYATFDGTSSFNVLEGSAQVFCTNVPTNGLPACSKQEDLRLRFASGTSGESEKIGLEKLSFACAPKSIARCVNYNNAVGAPIGELSLVPSNSVTFCQQKSGVTCEACK